jgi:hypothetical protein
VDSAQQEVALKASRLPSFAALGAALAVLPALIGLLTCPAAAEITVLEVVPAHPTIADSVSIRVEGQFLDGCWNPSPVDCGLVSGTSITIHEHVADHWQPGSSCPLVLMTYSARCVYGRLPAGQYRVVLNETHDSLRDPLPQQRSLIFTVSDATPVRLSSWARIKLLYR